MIKFYEVAPEYRESPIDDYDFNEGYWLHDVTVTGNRNYKKHETELYQLACYLHDEIGDYDYTVEDVKENYDIVDETALREAYDSTDLRMIMCLLMKALSGKEWKSSEIYGSTQSEWTVTYYPADMFDKEGIEWFEAAYWNTGSEWIVEEDGERTSYYTCEWDDEKAKVDLAEQCGVSVEECEFYKFDGWVRKPSYKTI